MNEGDRIILVALVIFIILTVLYPCCRAVLFNEPAWNVVVEFQHE